MSDAILRCARHRERCVRDSVSAFITLASWYLYQRVLACSSKRADPRLASRRRCFPCWLLDNNIPEGGRLETSAVDHVQHAVQRH